LTHIALQYPYVLAFEPSFVEIRHVESGQLVQVIKGIDLRCLFADTPPSAINYSHTSHQRGSGVPFNGRPPLGAPGYGPQGYIYKPPFVRDEILLMSYDKVMILRPALLTQNNDDASTRSSSMRR
jgi:RHO1 GDP-GTP exchange protein 1/2